MCYCKANLFVYTIQFKIKFVLLPHLCCRVQIDVLSNAKKAEVDYTVNTSCILGLSVVYCCNFKHIMFVFPLSFSIHIISNL